MYDDLFKQNPKRFPNWGDGEICPSNIIVPVYQGIREFYALEALSVMAKPIPFNHGHDKWVKEFEEFKTKFDAQFAVMFYDYAVALCLGEARHAPKECNYEIRYLTPALNERNSLWNCPHLEPTNALITCSKLFSYNKDWCCAYGGYAWQAIADGALLYKKVPDSVFIDHMVDLSHNNGIFYNKRNRIFFLDSSNMAVLNFLEFKKNQPPFAVWDVCQDNCTYEIKAFYKRALNLGIISPLTDKENIYLLSECYGGYYSAVSEQKEETTDNIMNYIPVKWGTSRIYPSDIDKKNGYYREVHPEDFEDEDKENRKRRRRKNDKSRFDRRGLSSNE